MRAEIERQQIDGVLRPDARKSAGWRREFRIEPDIDAVDAIEELEIAEQRRVGPDIADVQQLAPAVMADDDVRLEAELLQIGGRMRDDVGASHRPIQFARGDMRLSGGRAVGLGYGTVRTPESGSRWAR